MILKILRLDEPGIKIILEIIIIKNHEQIF